ncbi:MAG TPA: twin-arginine translocase subunit TatC, partial [Actinomycetota bacterium]
MMVRMAMESLGEGSWAHGLAGVLLNHRSLLERLGELRSRMFRALLALAIGSVIAWFFFPAILALLAHPLKSLPGAGAVVARGRLIFTAPQEAFFVRIKIVAFTGAAIASPVILWQLWRFLTEGATLGSTKRGIRYALVLVAVSVVLFA